MSASASPSKPLARRILSVHLPNFGLQARVRHEPSLAARPLALEPESSNGRILEVSRAARGKGVLPGSTIARAMASCPDLLIVSVSQADLAAIRREIVEALVPIVARVEWGGGGIFHAEIQGLIQLHGSEATILVRSAEALQSLGYLARIACASTRLCSLLAARTRQGLAIIREGGERELLDPLPLELSSLPRETLARLDLLGIRTLGALARLPADGIADRFGREVLRVQRLVRGEEIEPLMPLPDPSMLHAEIELDEPVTGLEPVIFLLKSCCERLSEDLEQSGLTISQLELRIQHEGAREHSDVRVIEPSRPLASAKALLLLCRTELEARALRSPLIGLALVAVGTTPRTSQSGDIFGRSFDLAALGAALDRVRTLLGTDRVVTPASRPAHRREARIAWSPFELESLTQAPAHSSLEAADAKGGLSRALRLLPRMLPALVRLPEDGPGSLSCATAARVGLGLALPEVAVIDSAIGPFRVSGEWWDSGADVDRDEYVLHAIDGAAYLVARDRRTRRWLMMGWFD